MFSFFGTFQICWWTRSRPHTSSHGATHLKTVHTRHHSRPKEGCSIYPEMAAKDSDIMAVSRSDFPRAIILRRVSLLTISLKRIFTECNYVYLDIYNDMLIRRLTAVDRTWLGNDELLAVKVCRGPGPCSNSAHECSLSSHGQVTHLLTGRNLTVHLSGSSC